MMHRSLLYSTLLIVILMSSCRSSRIAVNITPENHAVREYLEEYSAIAVSEMRRTGIPASIKLAQGMIESDHGRSRLAKVANNHFGIKCHSTWRGPVVYHDDDARGECFRKYSDPAESFHDHSDFLVNGSRYRSLFNLRPTDYKGWARGLKSAGYATNPAYADMLIKKIEANSLYLFDSGKNLFVSGSTDIYSSGRTGANAFGGRGVSAKGSRYPIAVANRVQTRNRVEFIIVSDTDNLESLNRDFALLSWELERYNELPVDSLIQPGNILYLQPKRKKAEMGVRHHIVREGETMYSISQIYAIKIASLYKMNFMTEGDQPETGRKINLR